MLQPGDITGLILSGGASSRMGADKGLIPFRGKALVEYPVRLLKDYCDKVLISTNNPDYAAFGYPLLSDNYKDAGPMGGLQAGLSASQTEYILVLPCDMPLLSHTFVELLIENINGYEAVVPRLDGQLIAVAACYRRSTLMVLEQCMSAGLYKMQRFVRRVHHDVLVLDNTPLARELVNINFLEDLKTLENTE